MISNMDEAIDFYVNHLGLELVNRYSNHYAELDANGFMVALHPTTSDVSVGNNVSIGLGVYNFDETIQMLESKGISFSFEKGGYIRLAHFKDPDGNPLFLAENT